MFRSMLMQSSLALGHVFWHSQESTSRGAWACMRRNWTKYKKVFVGRTKYISHLLKKSTQINSCLLKGGIFGITECAFMCGVHFSSCNCKNTIFFLQKFEAILVTFAHMHALDVQNHYRVVDVNSRSQKRVAFSVNSMLYGWQRQDGLRSPDCCVSEHSTLLRFARFE